LLTERSAGYVAVAGLMMIVTFVACYVPTRRAMALNPLAVLREQ
jgi:ABC-type lipoprotein release transport system permease subunit